MGSDVVGGSGVLFIGGGGRGILLNCRASISLCMLVGDGNIVSTPQNVQIHDINLTELKRVCVL